MVHPGYELEDCTSRQQLQPPTTSEHPGNSATRLLGDGAAKTEDVAAVVEDLEGTESVVGIGQFAVHGDFPAYELCVQGVGIIGVDVGVPGRPFVTRTIRLGMDLRGDGLEHEHDSVASKNGPEILVCLSVASSLIANVESQLGLIERKRSRQIVDNEKGSNTVQHGESAVDSKIA